MLGKGIKIPPTLPLIGREGSLQRVDTLGIGETDVGHDPIRAIGCWCGAVRQAGRRQQLTVDTQKECFYRRSRGRYALCGFNFTPTRTEL